MVWKPHVTVAAIACREDRFLMVEEDADGRIVFNQPAGHLDENETLVDAVVRETMEETAFRFEPEGITGIYQWRSPETNRTFLRVCFHGICTTEETGRALDAGILRAVWLTRDELLRQQHRLRSPMVLRCIDDFLTGRRYPLSVLADLNHA